MATPAAITYPEYQYIGSNQIDDELFGWLSEFGDFPQKIVLSGVSLEQREMESGKDYILAGTHKLSVKPNHSNYPELYLNGRLVSGRLMYENGNQCPIRMVVLRETDRFYPDPTADIQVVFATWEDLPDMWALYSVERIESVKEPERFVEVY